MNLNKFENEELTRNRRSDNIAGCNYECAVKVIERFARLDATVADINDYLCDMIRTIFKNLHGREITKEAIRHSVGAFTRSLGSDCLNTCNRIADNKAAHSVIQVYIWRIGLLFSMSAINNGELPGTGWQCTIHLLRELAHPNGVNGSILPNREATMRLMAFAAHAPSGELESAVRKLLSEMGFDVESPVRHYGHPIDSKLVKALDSDMINDVFRTFVDFNADRAMGQMIASSIPVTERNYPALNRIVDECVEKLCIRRPYVIVTNHMAGINAMAFGSDEEPYIAMTSLMTRIMSEDQMRFVIGHECGHIAMGHLVYHTAATVLGSLSQYIPVVGKLVYSGISIPLNAWARRSEITADRAGLHCCNNPEIAKKALLQLECAFNSADEIDTEAYIENSRRYLKGGIVRKIGEYGTNHPMTPKRIEALTLFSNSVLYYELMGIPAPTNAFSPKDLEKRIENILRVL